MRAERESRPTLAGNRTAGFSAGAETANSFARRTDTTRSLAEHLAGRLLQETLSNGLAATWRRRQRVLLAARPRPEDFHGQASRQELRDRWQRLTEAAAACGHAAELAEHTGGIFPEVWQALDEARGQVA